MRDGLIIGVIMIVILEGLRYFRSNKSVRLEIDELKERVKHLEDKEIG